MIGGTQDNGTLKHDGTSALWKEIPGGDGSTVDMDPSNVQILYTMGQYTSSVTCSTNDGVGFGSFGAGQPMGSVCFNLQFLVHPSTSAMLRPLHLSVAHHLVHLQVDDDLHARQWRHRARRHRSVGEPVLRWDGERKVRRWARWRIMAGGVRTPPNGGFSDVRVDPDDKAIIWAIFGGRGDKRKLVDGFRLRCALRWTPHFRR